MAVRRFRPPLKVKLKDPDGEKARQNHEDRIADLEKTIQALADSEPRWELVQRSVLKSAATRIGFSGLRGNRDVEYLVRGYVIDVSGSTSLLELRPNGTNGTRSQRLSGTGSTTSAFSNSGGIFIGRCLANDGVCTFEGTFYVRTGDLRVWRGVSSSHETATPTTYSEVHTGYWSNTTAEVTQLEVESPTSDGLGAGTEIALYRRAD